MLPAGTKTVVGARGVTIRHSETLRKLQVWIDFHSVQSSGQRDWEFFLIGIGADTDSGLSEHGLKPQPL
jgi:hypothetical protein